MNSTYTVTLTWKQMYTLMIGALEYDIQQSKLGNPEESKDAWNAYMALSTSMREQDSSTEALVA